MGTQYFCKNPARRVLLEQDGTLNGIDYLEVEDSPLLPDDQRQRKLYLHLFLEPAADWKLKLKVRIQEAPGASKVAVMGVTLDAIDHHFLVVEVDHPGDYNPYTLSLELLGDAGVPPDGFDAAFTQVEFSFKVECPSEFDCKSEVVCPPEKQLSPAIDYLAKDYASFRQLMLDRLSAVAPDWKERNPADLGVALVEILALAGDQLSYFQDAVATEAYLGTARRRTSVRRHVRLLDYVPHEGCNARVWMAIEVAPESNGAKLPARTRLCTAYALPATSLRPEEEKTALAAGALLFETMEEITLREAHNQIALHTWEDSECCLPRGATQATLVDENGALDLRKGDVLIFEQLQEASGAETVNPMLRHAVRLCKQPRKLQDPLSKKHHDVVEICWYAEDALPFPLCLSAVIAGQAFPGMCVARGNVVLAEHGRTVEEKLPLPAEARTDGVYRPRLKMPGLAFAERYDPEPARNRSAARTVEQDPRKALPAIQLSNASESWKPQSDLLNSGRFAREFVVEMEEDFAYLRFGDSRTWMGREPRSELTAAYRIGNGREGAVGADAIRHVFTLLPGITRVRNPLPAHGGVDPEPMEQVRLFAPQAFRTQERAVTEADYARVAERHPQVQRAAATLRWTGSWHTMFLTLDRKGGLPVDDAFEQEVRDFMERFRLAGQDLEVDGPRFVPLEIVLTVCVQPGYFATAVKRALLETFSSSEMPGGRRGFFHPDRFTFGQPVYLSPVVAAAMAVPGVHWVDATVAEGKPNRFQQWGQRFSPDAAEEGFIRIGRLQVARLDNDPSAPQNGRIEFIMEGGL